MPHTRDSKLIVIDRDGTLNPDPEDYLRSPDDWQPLPGRSRRWRGSTRPAGAWWWRPTNRA